MQLSVNYDRLITAYLFIVISSYVCDDGLLLNYPPNLNLWSCSPLANKINIPFLL